jgi:hypothetical protein
MDLDHFDMEKLGIMDFGMVDNRQPSMRQTVITDNIET